MTKDGKCSDCKRAYIEAGNGDYKICPKCHSVLWHTDWEADERRLRAVAAAAAKLYAEQAKQKRLEEKAAKTNVELKAESLVVSAPILGEPDVT